MRRPAGSDALAPPGRVVEVEPEKIVAGGLALARLRGEVLLVAGALPGERVRARVRERARGVAFGETLEVLVASPDRREPSPDPACGGRTLDHVSYPRQLSLKRDIVIDAFARVGRLRQAEVETVVPSPERGYRLRARLHATGERLGFVREGTHAVCDPASTGQLRDDTVGCLQQFWQSLGSCRTAVSRVDVAENLDASERAVHIEYRDRGAVATLVERARSTPGLTGVSAWSPGSDGSVASGVPWVRDPLSALMQGAVVEGWLRRHPAAFFQGNRFLLGALVSEVTGRTDGDVLDLYAGVGLFGVVLAAASTTRRVVAVEEDRAAARDLAANAAPFGDRMRVHEASAEAVLSGSLRDRPETIIVDPPRVGLSRTVTERLAAARAPRIVYVACDAATFARDARRLIEAGYEMSAVRPFDLFPTTAHVECVTSFTRT